MTPSAFAVVHDDAFIESKGIPERLQELCAYGVVLLLGGGAAELPREDEPELFVLHQAVAPVKVGNGVVVAEIYIREPAQRIRIKLNCHDFSPLLKDRVQYLPGMEEYFMFDGG